ncbi:DUF3307 domain-containing protein [Mediterraneibacter glycyrrhizinilyticus]|nr:DUF3307 domain-containing protein [Mediterraneibacter glycyrrhizinilyticus]
MIKTVFTILLCVHLLGDFYFQTQKMADSTPQSGLCSLPSLSHGMTGSQRISRLPSTICWEHC